MRGRAGSARNLAVGHHPQRGTLYAVIDASAHHVVGAVADLRFAAFLTPFRSRQEAEAALVAAGCSISEPAQ